MRTPGFCLALIASAQLVIASTPAFAADAPAASADGMVMVHIKSDKPVSLQKRAGESGSWETVCSSPCDMKVSVSDQYQVTGDGVNPSKPFMLNTSGSTANLDITVGSEKTKSTGLIVLGVGGALTLGGLLVALIGGGTGGVSGTGAGDDGTTHNKHTNMFWVGGALVMVGVATGIYGGAMFVNSAHSQVEGDVAKPQPVRGQNKTPDAGHYEAKNATPVVPVFTVPIFQGKF
jgi:hypothetical protein